MRIHKRGWDGLGRIPDEATYPEAIIGFHHYTVKNGVLRYTFAMVFWDTFICWCSNITLWGVLVHNGVFHITLKICSKVE